MDRFIKVVIFYGFLLFAIINISGAQSTTDMIGGTTGTAYFASGSWQSGGIITASANGTLQSIGINFDNVRGEYIEVAIYAYSNFPPYQLIAQSASTLIYQPGWNDIPISGVSIIKGNRYIIEFQGQAGTSIFHYTDGLQLYSSNATYGVFPKSWIPNIFSQLLNMRMTYAYPQTTTSTTTTTTVYTTSITTSTSVTSLSSTITASSTNNLGFSIYTTNSTLLQTYKGFYTNMTHGILMDDEYNSTTGTYRNYLAYFNKPQTFSRMLLGDSLPQIQNTLNFLTRSYNFSAKDIVNYDAENWVSTPITEQLSQAYYVQQACITVHNAGYNFSYTPQIHGLIGTQLESINWTCINYFDIQEQGNSWNTSILLANTSREINISKVHGNPNIKIYVQLDMNVGINQIKADIAALNNLSGVNGIVLTYVNDQCLNLNCNKNNLVSLVSYINSYASETAALKASGFSNITISSITSNSSATVFDAIDTMIGKNVIVFALPYGYRYMHWISGNPWLFEYMNNSKIEYGTLSVNNTEFYPGRQDITNQITWKEAISFK